jgi:hypothetical protein
MILVKIFALFLLCLKYAEPRMIFEELDYSYGTYQDQPPDDLMDKRYFDIDKIKSELFVEATFYSREETSNNIPAGGVRGVTLKEAKQGEGVLQVATDPNVIPTYTKVNRIHN